jgi:hypothetical protein
VGGELGVATLLLSEANKDAVAQEGYGFGKALEEHLHQAAEPRSDGDELPGDVSFGCGL